MNVDKFAAYRMVLRDMGKAGLVIMVLATAAFDPEDSDNEGTAPTSGWQRANLGFVSAYILYRDGEAALIDTGVFGSDGRDQGRCRRTRNDLGFGEPCHHHPPT